MQGSGLTLFALVFMSVSMLAVTALMAWCFWRILRGGDHGYDQPDATAAARERRGGSPAR